MSKHCAGSFGEIRKEEKLNAGKHFFFERRRGGEEERIKGDKYRSRIPIAWLNLKRNPVLLGHLPEG